jgi:hypothetical protein
LLIKSYWLCRACTPTSSCEISQKSRLLRCLDGPKQLFGLSLSLSLSLSLYIYIYIYLCVCFTLFSSEVVLIALEILCFDFYSTDHLWTALSPVQKFTRLRIWAPSMCGFSCSKCLFRICYKVNVIVTHATDSFEVRDVLFVIGFLCMYVLSLRIFCSIVHNSEFSACLSVGSILRLRAAAITALSQDTKTDTAMIFRLARRFLYVSKYQRNRTDVEDAYSGTIMAEDLNHHNYGSQYQNDSQGSLLCF